MIPHTFVLEPGLRIHKIYNGYWYWGRPSTSELHTDLRDVTRKCRWYFDLGNPGVRVAWERGENERFSPYGKSFRQMFVRMAGEVDQFEYFYCVCARTRSMRRSGMSQMRATNT